MNSLKVTTLTKFNGTIVFSYRISPIICQTVMLCVMFLHSYFGSAETRNGHHISFRVYIVKSINVSHAKSCKLVVKFDGK
jgi:hypothetical protein